MDSLGEKYDAYPTANALTNEAKMLIVKSNSHFA